MNLKKSISLMLASTAISTAFSGVVSACPGLEFAFGDKLAAHELMNRQRDGGLYPPAGQGTPDINIPPMQNGEIRRFAFSLNNGGGNIIGFLGQRNDPVNDVFGDYTVEVITTGGVDGNQQPVPTGVGTGVPGLIDIVPIQHGDAVVIEFRAQGQGMVDGIIRIQSNSSALPLSIRFHCQVN